MNIPIEWLSEYIKLPREMKQVTDRLTSIGHMLDKTRDVNGHPVIDLELRGNRADMFSVYGVAREISAALDLELKSPETAALPKKDKTHPLITVEKNAADLVKRFEALRLKVKIGPSPAWLVKRLESMDIPAINNVVDITNYVMMETGEPMHAFDYHRLEGGRLILRRAKKAEKFSTIQQGLVVTLSDEDLVIGDEKSAQSLTAIGGLHSKVTNETQEIILEAAVYDPANSRRSSRRLKIFTNGSMRHEKHLDPAQVEFALQRAVYLLQEHADAKIVGETSDYYPEPAKLTVINFDLEEIFRLVGLTIPENEVITILQKLGFGIVQQATGLKITVPTFRTDIADSADIVEEIIRIYGYDQIPSTPISDTMPIPQTYDSYTIQEKLRDVMISLGFDEIITLTMTPNEWNPEGIKLINPPDPDRATLRSSLVPGLRDYAKRLLNFNRQRVAIFEVGKVFSKSGNKYLENIKLGFAIAGMTSIKQWNSKPEAIDENYLNGVTQTLFSLLGIKSLNSSSYDLREGVYTAEFDVLEILNSIPKFTNPYKIVSSFAELVEDYNIAAINMSYSDLKQAIESVSPYVKRVQLIDRHGDKLTLRVTYHSDDKQLSGEDIVPLRAKLEELGKE